MFFYTKNKEKEAKRNEINFLKNYFVTVSFIFAINGHNIYVLINNNNNYKSPYLPWPLILLHCIVLLVLTNKNIIPVVRKR